MRSHMRGVSNSLWEVVERSKSILAALIGLDHRCWGATIDLKRLISEGRLLP